MAHCAESSLAWDANTEPDLVGYYLYYKTGVSGAPYDGTGADEGDSPIQVPVSVLNDPAKPEFTIHGLTDTEIYFLVATAYDSDGNESGFSKEISYIYKPASNLPPSKATVVYPGNGEHEVDEPLTITSEPFSDPNSDAHRQSQWQISEQSDFSTLVFDVTSQNCLTAFQVPHMVLLPNQKYYARVRFYDTYYEPSDWSSSVEFTTSSFWDDFNSNGIPDDYELDNSIDFNSDGIPDTDQPNTIKCIKAVDGWSYVGIEKNSSSIREIEALGVIDPETIFDTAYRPDDLLFGLFSYRLHVSRPGDTAKLRIYFSEAIFPSDVLFKYDTINSWHDYSEHATFGNEGQSVILELKDGGYGDSDGTANGIIVDPLGIASGNTYMSNSSNMD
ncbi:MAG: hypothetical protein JSV38_05820, partial [Desulfobacterales bacterium]